MSSRGSNASSPTSTPGRKTRSKSIRKSVGMTLNPEDEVKQEGTSDVKQMKLKRRRSTKQKAMTFSDEPSEASIDITLDVEIKFEPKEEEDIKPKVEENKDDDIDRQLSFIQNFKLESDDEEFTSVERMSLIDVQRKLYIRECEKIGVIPVRAVAELTENLKELNVSHFHLGPRGAMALAIPLHLDDTIITLNMEYNDIGPYGCQAIAEVLLENNSIADVNLAHNNIGSYGLACLCRIFKSNISVVRLDLSGNRFCDTSSKFMPFLFTHPFLKELLLSQNGFDIQAAKAFGELLASNESLEYLDLSWNHFRFRSAEAIAKGLKDNTGLKKLDLRYNGFGSEGVAAIAKALAVNTTLQELDITHNRITDQGIEDLCKGLHDNTSLTHLKVGGNVLTKFAATALVTMIQHSGSALVSLDIQDVFVDQVFLNLINEIKQTKKLFVTHGSLEDLEISKLKLMEAKQKAAVVVARADNLCVDNPQENQVSENPTEEAKSVPEAAEEVAEKPPEEKEKEVEIVEENLSELQIDAAGGSSKKTHFA